MEVLEFLLKRNVLTGVAVGIGASILVPVLIPAVAAVGRPAAKLVMKTGITVYESGRQLVSGVGRGVSGLYSEAQTEMTHQGQPPAAPAQ